MLEAATQALTNVADPAHLLMLLVGVTIGLAVGLLPGLGGTVGFSLLLPFVYGMDQTQALAMLIGMAGVISFSDTFPSILMGIPGSSGSQATVIDGYPLARDGQAARALGAALTSSLIGGLFGALVLGLVIPISRPIILAFGSPELFMLAIMGLSMVGVLSADQPLKGLLAGFAGLMIGTIGAAPAVPEYRYSFEILYLFSGIPLVILALGLFAIPEIIDLLSQGSSIAKTDTRALGKGWWTGVKDALKNKWLVLRCSGIGVLVGFIPGLGGSVVDWISYGQAKATVRGNYFGKGDIRGVIAPESSNNAKEGGALIPTLLFGIPGSGGMAVLLGGFALLGVQPGPSMVTTNLDFTYTAVWSLAVASVFGAVICLFLSKPIAKLTSVPFGKLAPFIIVVILLGAFQATRSWGDFIALLAIGLLGWVMKRFNWPRPALLVGFVLATSAERYLFISMSRYGFQWLLHPGVIVLGLITIGLLIAGFRLRGTGNATSQQGGVSA